ncbi:hypothetical protein [Sporosarcina sp. NPDC096371]|uniref:hypothetical protein n=1 Tax=Sporosarcina sp. NPDC096371 TaxID=3364530 RepID=UPI00380F8FE5
MMHPTIERTIETGYPFGEPVVYTKCKCCGEEIHKDELSILHASELFCGPTCLGEYLEKIGLAEWSYAGQ